MRADGEALAIAILAAALPGGSRIATKTPGGRTTPWVLVKSVDAVDVARDYLVDYMVQISCYAGESNDSVAVSATARSCAQALYDARNRVFAGSRVTNTRTTGPGGIPDPDMQPARERYIVTATISAHPA